MPKRFWIAQLASLVAACGLPALARSAPIVMNSPTTSWTPIYYPGVAPDYANEQSTGQEEADLVGDLGHPAFYTAFDDAGTSSLTDGFLAFRLRLGADKNPAGFGKSALVGIDANSDGALDLFALVDNTGANRIAIYNAGAGANTSPATTSITTTGLTYVETAANYDWSQVTVSIDPSATIFDLDSDGNVDHFLSFAIPLQDLITRLAAIGITGVNETTSFRYVIGTSTNANTLNQDIGGPNGSLSSVVDWSSLGAISNPYAPTGAVPVPEPGSAALLAFGLALVARLRRR